LEFIVNFIKFKNMKKILLIGGNGYIGNRLYKDHSTEYDIISVDNCWFDNPIIPTIQEDFNDLTEDFLSKFDVIILLAGHSSVKMCEGPLLGAYDNNIRNFVKLASKLKPYQKFIYASSSSAHVHFSNIVWGEAGSGHVAVLHAGTEAVIQAGRFYVAANAPYHWKVWDLGVIRAWGAQYNIPNPVSITVWLSIATGGIAEWGTAVFTGISNVTGRKYTLVNGGVAKSGGLNPSSGVILPGTLAGQGALVAAECFWGV
jgi:hypothetical protein